MATQGERIKAGQLLTRYIKEIANEETEVSPDSQFPKMITKAEALARLIWKHALGFKDKEINDKGVETEIRVKPSLAHQNIVLDRIEGKIGVVGDSGEGGTPLHQRVSAEGRKRINSLTGGGKHAGETRSE
jgi:hypothetical protein